MTYYFLSSTLVVLWMIGLASVETEEEGVVYYVSPTEPLSSCPGNSSCPPGQLCHTMDYFTEHSSQFFSPDHVNITLIFMCGVHNYTKDLMVQNLHSFVMKGTEENRENMIIDHQFVAQNGEPNCSVIQFFKASFVNITNLTMRCPAINLQESHITVKNSYLYGYSGIKESLSFIYISGSGSQALLDNCTFGENCAITSNFSDGIVVSNSTFQSYQHQVHSIIEAYSSAVTLTGNVNFTDSVTGICQRHYSSSTAVLLRTTNSEHKSSLTVKTGANVYFVNLTCSSTGAGAVYAENGMIHVAKARVVFMHNTAAGYFGGAVFLKNGMMTVCAESYVTFTYNHASIGGAVYVMNGMVTISTESYVTFMYNSAADGGAVWLSSASLIVESHASLRFSHNSVESDGSGGAVMVDNGNLTFNSSAKINFSNNSACYGGALELRNSVTHVDTAVDGIQFDNNRASWGGAMFFVYGTLYINSTKSVKFMNNSAQIRGGMIYIEAGINSFIIVDNSTKLLIFNNSAFQGGAFYVVPSSFVITVGYQSSIQFINNTAFDVGGAVYYQSLPPCIFMITDYSVEVNFKGNRAQCGVGHHMYGASVRDATCGIIHITSANKQGKPHCWLKNQVPEGYIRIFFDPGLNETLSPVSSAPQRVCLCDSNGKPQCANISYIFTNASVYRGETITLPASIVGYDFGTTVGVIHARLLHSDPLSNLDNSQQVFNNEKCFPFNYTVYSIHDYELLLLQTSFLPASAYINNESTIRDIFKYKDTINREISDYISHDQFGCIIFELLTTPIFINITLLPGCPPGLTLNHDQTTCSCYPALANDGFKCSIMNKTGLLQWNSTVWVDATFNDSHSTGIIYNRFCPLLYCKSGNKTVNIGNDPSKQCASNRTGILCGACMDNFSLAIGSSRCIECPNSHNVALLLAFAAAGVFFVLLILALNLTVTQGLINGVIFYANIVWAYRIILFPPKALMIISFLQVFVAWLNLDFGIETCFFIGLDDYWKTWLQFLFPFYVWAIAGVIIVACRYSSCLTNLIGSRAVPLLATLFLLSYMKLLRTAIDATSVAVIAQYPQNTSYAVWYLDGNLRYCQHPHIYLFIAAIAALVFLWLPYTLLLLFIQPLRKASHLRPLKWINKLAPVYDAYFSPLKDKYRYWFGVMLLVRGILLVLLTITSVEDPELNVFVLFLFTAFLFFFVSIKNVYKDINVRLLESATLLNLIVLSTGTLFKWEFTESRSTLLIVSIGITFAQFCVIIVFSLMKPCLSAYWWYRRNQGYDAIIESNDYVHERIEDRTLQLLLSHTRSNNSYTFCTQKQ